MSPDSPYGRALRSALWIPALTLTLAVLVALVVTARQPRVYRASATAVVTPGPKVDDTEDVLRSLDTLERRSVIATFARVPPSPARRAAAVRRAHLDPARASDFHVEASVLPNTNILKIDVEGPDAAASAALANALIDETDEEVRRLYRIFTLQSLAPAVAPARPARPDARRNAVAGGILGLVLGAAAASLVARLRVRPPHAG
jgi:capsular polysaccharide biosynthesis protein